MIGPEAIEMAAAACLDDEQMIRSAIKTAFSQLMRCDPATVSQQVYSLVQRLQSAPDECKLDSTTLSLSPLPPSVSLRPSISLSVYTSVSPTPKPE